QDFETYAALAERVPETVGMIHLAFGQYAQDFMSCNGYRVNPDTGELEFSYPDPSEPEAPPVYRLPLSVEIETIKDENAFLALELASTQARLDQAEQEQADLLLTLVSKGVI